MWAKDSGLLLEKEEVYFRAHWTNLSSEVDISSKSSNA